MAAAKVVEAPLVAPDPPEFLVQAEATRARVSNGAATRRRRADTAPSSRACRSTSWAASGRSRFVRDQPPLAGLVRAGTHARHAGRHAPVARHEQLDRAAAEGVAGGSAGPGPARGVGNVAVGP